MAGKKPVTASDGLFVEKVYDKMKAQILPNHKSYTAWRGKNKKKKSKGSKK